MDWRALPDSQTSSLEDVEVYVRCGLHPWERHPERPNRLLVSVAMHTTAHFDPATGAGYIDYDRVRDHLKTWAERPHIDLLETTTAAGPTRPTPWSARSRPPAAAPPPCPPTSARRRPASTWSRRRKPRWARWRCWSTAPPASSTTPSST